MEQDLTKVMKLYNRFIDFQVKKCELIEECRTIVNMSDQLREREKDEELACFEKNVELPATIFYGSEVFKTKIAKITIYYDFNEYEFFNVGFSLVLAILTPKGIIYFTIATTEQENETINPLKINRRNLTFFEENTGTLKVYSRQNFQEILDICHSEVKNFNEQAPVKLINRLIKT